MKTEHSGLLNGEFLFDVINVSLTFKLCWIRSLETWLESHLHLSHNFRANQNLKVSRISSSIPIVCNMSTVHDFAVDVSKILIWNDFVLAEIVVEHITADCQITIIEGVELRPAL